MLTGRVIGAQKVAERFATMPARLQDEMVRAVTSFTLKLSRHVKTQKLTGQVLNVRTGRLRRSIHHEVHSGAGRVTGFVGTNVVYAAPHEFGGQVTVKEHLRTIKQAWGKALKEPKVVSVKQHSVTYKERSFLRSSLKEMRGEFFLDLQKGVARAAK